LLGFVDQNEVPDLYRSAEAVVFPSFYEGFGLPVLEAMACGVPLACSNRGSLPEVAGEASVQFDPARVEELVVALRQILTPGPQREALVQAGLAQAARFSWERTARATWQALIGSLEE
jgi:alpha-1,3-rhamnosyl/mannosyltransferase